MKLLRPISIMLSCAVLATGAAAQSDEFAATMARIGFKESTRTRTAGSYVLQLPAFAERGGYPLVHNASLCPDLGYYYPDNDVVAGCGQLLTALAHHDDTWEAYRNEQRRLIARHLPGDAALTERYAELLANLMTRPLV